MADEDINALVYLMPDAGRAGPLALGSSDVAQ